ncbi:ankyrin [Pseudoneurospora amorphoporcata]|uniref:Ankyrin n=1 Tax=Pseudoneurospora amorphoporcata TaxID=241081 RepID=A0AAN6SBE2_9PEZI|nr:ankyrin [Pseudoneurospora amorphoporcata]
MARSRYASATYTNNGDGTQIMHDGHGCQNITESGIINNFQYINNGPIFVNLPPNFPFADQGVGPNIDTSLITEPRQHRTTGQMRGVRRASSIETPRLLRRLRSYIDRSPTRLSPNHADEHAHATLSGPRSQPQRRPYYEPLIQTAAFLIYWLPGPSWQDPQGRNSVHDAVQRQYHFALPFLLEFLEDPLLALSLGSIDIPALLNTRDLIEQRTPAHYAALLGDRHSLKLLVDKGADVEVADKHGNTVLHIAAQKGWADVVKLLLENGAKIDERDREGYTPLHLAAAHGRQEAVELLLDAGAKRDVKEGFLEKTALHSAVENKHLSTVRALVRGLGYEAAAWDRDRDRALVDDKDCQKRTALHLACRIQGGPADLRMASDMVHILIEAGAKLDVKDAEGRTALMYAAQRANLAAVKCLVRKGADVGVKDGRHEGPGGRDRTARDYATDFEPRGRDWEEVVRFLSRGSGGSHGLGGGWMDSEGLLGGLCTAAQTDG